MIAIIIKIIPLYCYLHQKMCILFTSRRFTPNISGFIGCHKAINHKGLFYDWRKTYGGGMISLKSSTQAHEEL